MNMIEPQYSGAGVIIIEKYHNKCALFIVQENSGVWSIPGGKKEENNDVVTTAHKELLEETRGFFDISIDILKKCEKVDIKKNDKKYKVYILYVNSDLPISRENYYSNKYLLDNSNFPNFWKETKKLDRIYLDIFLRNNI